MQNLQYLTTSSLSVLFLVVHELIYLNPVKIGETAIKELFEYRTKGYSNSYKIPLQYFIRTASSTSFPEQAIKFFLIKNKIDAYLITTGDYHNSEYISEYFKTRAYMSEFTGSAGMLLVLQDKAYLWADGRYHIQASQEINPSITLMKQGLPGVPTIKEFLTLILTQVYEKIFSKQVI